MDDTCWSARSLFSPGKAEKWKAKLEATRHASANQRKEAQRAQRFAECSMFF